MARLPRTECPVCTRDVAVTARGLVYRHDPATGRSPDLRSCPGSLKPVQAPEGELLLFVGLEEFEDPAQPAPASALF
ncbi:hypothetical protein [Streptomyces abyssomicinicus]|uniref:hypothetical protein n=1 Tax=Streptomyces abyssomicinicus TaxID=574929 RepID=UPI0012503590|nr:hypothetical protein [Streptomyces abyssomicinicus]